METGVTLFLEEKFQRGMISNSVTHLRSNTNSAIASIARNSGPSADIAASSDDVTALSADVAVLSTNVSTSSADIASNGYCSRV